MSDKFFVYGTLKVGGYFAGAFDKLRTNCQPAKLKGFNLFRIGGDGSWFPGIVRGDGEVTGELHSYDDEYFNLVRNHMDAIEGYNPKSPKNSFYRRTTAIVELDDGTEEEAIVYIFNDEIKDDYAQLKSGVWPIDSVPL